MIDVSNVLLKISDVLNQYEIEEVSSTAKLTEIRVKFNDREEARSKVQMALERNRIAYGPAPKSKSSFTGTQVTTSSGILQLIYKPLRGAGSGAGAALTKLTECSQCLYAAIAFGLKRNINSSDITKENAMKFSSMYNTDESLNNMLNKLPDEWIESCILGANMLWKQFGNKGNFIFHRGSNLVDRIENNFKRIQKIENVRMNLNKWSPADIYMEEKKFDIKCLDEEKTILGLNQCIQERIQNNTLLGVSLKKIVGSAKISLKNVYNDMKTTRKYTGYTYSDSSMDMYLLLDNNTKIQFRSFGGQNSLTGWQGEVKGSQANQGKISLGPINMILKNHGLPTVPNNARTRVTGNSNEREKVFKEIEEGYKKYTSSRNPMNFIVRQEDSWLYSKLQATQLLNIIENISNKEKQNQVLEDFYLYASSQSKYSAAYYKLE